AVVARDPTGQHLLVGVTDMRWQICVINRRGDKKCFQHFCQNLPTRASRATATVDTRLWRVHSDGAQRRGYNVIPCGPAPGCLYEILTLFQTPPSWFQFDSGLPL